MLLNKKPLFLSCQYLALGLIHITLLLHLVCYARPAKQMRRLYFHPVVSSSIYLLFFSPTLSRRRLDVYHTSTHGVALARI